MLFSRMNDIFAKDTHKALQKRPGAQRKRPEQAASQAASAAKETASAGRKRKLKVEPGVNILLPADQSKKITKVKESPAATPPAAAAVASSVTVNDELSKPVVKVEKSVEEVERSSGVTAAVLTNKITESPAKLEDTATVKGEPQKKEESEAELAVTSAVVDSTSSGDEAPTVLDDSGNKSAVFVTASAESVPVVEDLADVTGEAVGDNVVTATTVNDKLISDSGVPLSQTQPTELTASPLKLLYSEVIPGPTAVVAASPVFMVSLSQFDTLESRAKDCPSDKSDLSSLGIDDQSTTNCADPTSVSISSDLTKSLRKVRLAKKAVPTSPAKLAAATVKPTSGAAILPVKLPLPPQDSPVKLPPAAVLAAAPDMLPTATVSTTVPAATAATVPVPSLETVATHGPVECVQERAAIVDESSHSFSSFSAAVAPLSQVNSTTSAPGADGETTVAAEDAAVLPASQGLDNPASSAAAAASALRMGTEVFDFTDDDDVDIPLSNIDFEALNINPAVAVVSCAVDLPRLSGGSCGSGPLQISIPPPPVGAHPVGVVEYLLTPRSSNSNSALASHHHHHLVVPQYHQHRSPIKKVFDVSPTILSRVDAMAAVEAVVGGGCSGEGTPTPPPHIPHQQTLLNQSNHNRSLGSYVHHATSGQDIMSDDTDTSLGGPSRHGGIHDEHRVKLGKRRRPRRMQESDGDGDTEDDQLEAGTGTRPSRDSLPCGRPKRTKTIDGGPPSVAPSVLQASATVSTRPSSAASGTSTSSAAGRGGELGEDRRSGEEGRGGGRLPPGEEDDGKQSPDSQRSNEDKSRWAIIL
jgi:hypothetical protein